ncbi:sugar nucleotide-binding protein [Cutibacterium sp. WCA-380-WT-3A]|uniref:dTDP-4-dehydrorhamnose reductase n=1 Tax=Cutibacterium porci TaxID=2605781 RepID=A0A7K0J4I6_9ACTN|nr:sugar nucleotide-binding protein [Cutibacterium porci]MSS44844.1 sugar nucleotide-binding protein [Cutibacterium porci]
MSELNIDITDIPGLLVLHLPLHGDNRGWFKENWQREKMIALGLPDFRPVQNNMSHNTRAGVTRGMHAEPWDKLISVATGRILGAWVDLRDGDSLGTVVTIEMGPETAVFVPRGVANGYQALEDGTTYTYLVNDHWSAEAKKSYTFVNLADPVLGINWPISLNDAELSEADRNHPPLSEVTPIRQPRTVVLGSNGQLGQALRPLLPDAEFTTRATLDLSDQASLDGFDWDNVSTIINAAAYTAVDAAEDAANRVQVWATNVSGVAHLTHIAAARRATLVHISSDYVFDGTKPRHTEDERVSPLSVYGITKAAADEIVASYPHHYLLRTSWVVGEGSNFVDTMASLARRGINPHVVSDQYGRLTFARDLAAAIVYVLETDVPFGTYNLSNEGPAQSWFDIATEIFTLLGARGTVIPTSTAEWGKDKNLAPRPTYSTLDLSRIEAAGFTPQDATVRLREYLGLTA